MLLDIILWFFSGEVLGNTTAVFEKLRGREADISLGSLPPCRIVYIL
jgi:hypothetical protein